MNTKKANMLLVLVSIVMLLFLNFPILSIFEKLSFINHIPILWIYIFTIWLVFIFMVFIIGYHTDKK